ncbi:MAG: large repetitive protein, partial [Frankiales bacterium]|nr:large repetitive protein [Frankiales bacterium]
FTPTAAGLRSATLQIYDSAPDSPQNITLTGNPAPATATLSSTSIAFGTQAVGTTSPSQFVTLTNNGDVPLVNNGLWLTGVDGGDFSDFSGDPGTCGDTIAAHSSCQVGANFHPTGPGPRTTTLVINDSAPDSPQTITLTGNPAPATATLSSTSIAFGTQAVGTISAPGYVTLTNGGDLPLTVNGLAAAGADPGDFSGDTGTCPPSLAPQASCKLGATFRPTAAGPRSMTLQVYDSAPGSPQSITLTGTGLTTPAAPVMGTATAGDSRVTVAFTAPASDGASPVISYTATVQDVTHPASGGQTATGTTSPITVTGLTNGDTYTVTVTAANLLGAGPASAPSNAVSPTTPATPPAAPSRLTATPGSGQVVLGWTPPAAGSGSPVTGYEVFQSVTAGAESSTPVNASPLPATATTFAVRGLANGTRYYFTVRAINDAGTSAPSNEVSATPTGLLAISTTRLAAGRVGVPYAARLTARGGSSPYRWALATGAHLPAGLLLHPDGSISGTPTKAQTSSVRVQVTDAAHPAHTATRQLTLTIAAAPQAPDLKLTAAHQGNFLTGHLGAYRLTVTNTRDAATAGPTTVTFALPPGLSYIAATGGGWACSQAGFTVTCTHRAALGPSVSSSIVVTVRISAPHGSTLTTNWTVSPTDHTPGDNTTTDRVTVQ